MLTLKKACRQQIISMHRKKSLTADQKIGAHICTVPRPPLLVRYYALYGHMYVDVPCIKYIWIEKYS